MSDLPETPETTAPQAEPSGEQPEAKPESETLGDAGKKALSAERAAKKAMEKERNELAARVKAFEDEKKTDAEKQAERMAELEKQATTAKVEALRFKYAAKHSISDEDADAFLTGGDEKTIARQAERLAELVGSAAPKAQPGAHVPGEGRTPSAPNLDDEIAEAQRNRNFARVIQLKNQQAAQRRQR